MDTLEASLAIATRAQLLARLRSSDISASQPASAYKRQRSMPRRHGSPRHVKPRPLRPQALPRQTAPTAARGAERPLYSAAAVATTAVSEPAAVGDAAVGPNSEDQRTNHPRARTELPLAGPVCSAAAQRIGAASEGATTDGSVYSAAAALIAAASDGDTDARNTGASVSARPLDTDRGRRRLRGKQTVIAAATSPAAWRGTEPPG